MCKIFGSSKRLVFLIALTIAFATTRPNDVRAQAAATLNAVADTADRICGIVATSGSSDRAKTQAEIHLELNGLARRFASAGISGGHDITSSEYQGLLQEDLPTSLQQVRDCKLQVFNKLQATLLPNQQSRPLGPGAPGKDLIQSPSNADLISSFEEPSQKQIGLYSCSSQPSGIVCYFVLTKLSAGQDDYSLPASWTDRLKFIDNFHVEHKTRSAFFIDGLGARQRTLNLSKGESGWVIAEFESGPTPVSSCRLVFAMERGSPQLSGPVN